jgi:hypothetical protein
MFIFQITVNGFRTSNNSALRMMFLEILSEQACIGVWIVTSNDY